jgi:hypothetical protein
MAEDSPSYKINHLPMLLNNGRRTAGGCGQIRAHAIGPLRGTACLPSPQLGGCIPNPAFPNTPKLCWAAEKTQPKPQEFVPHSNARLLPIFCINLHGKAGTFCRA